MFEEREKSSETTGLLDELVDAAFRKFKSIEVYKPTQGPGSGSFQAYLLSLKLQKM